MKYEKDAALDVQKLALHTRTHYRLKEAVAPRPVRLLALRRRAT